MKYMEIVIKGFRILLHGSQTQLEKMCLSWAAGRSPAGRPQHSDSDKQALQKLQRYNYFLILQHLAHHSIQQQPESGAPV